MLEAEGNLLLHRFAKELDLGVLEDNAREALATGGGAVSSIQPELAGGAAQQGDVVQPGEMQSESGLAGAGRADDAHAFSRLDPQGDGFEERRVCPSGLKGQLLGPDQARTLIMRVMWRFRMRDHTTKARPAAAALRIIEVRACMPNSACVTFVQGSPRT